MAAGHNDATTEAPAPEAALLSDFAAPEAALLSDFAAPEAALLSDFAALEAALLSDFAALVALRMACDLGAMAGLARGALRAGNLGLPPEGARLLLAMLRAAGIAEPQGSDLWRLTPTVAALWSARSASVEARARFVLMAAGDVIAQAPALFRDPRAFVAQARTFGFFDYGRAMRDGAAAQEDSAPWVRYVSHLNADEAPYLAPLIPLDGCTTLLEVGGNTGGFARALLDLHPGLRAMVFDLPAVCSLGRQAQAGNARLSFHPGDARAGDWPMVAAARPDAVLFKSVLHDWDAASAVTCWTGRCGMSRRAAG